MVGAGQPVVQEFTDDEVAGAAQALKLAFGSYDGESAYPEWVQGQLAKARRALQSRSKSDRDGGRDARLTVAAFERLASALAPAQRPHDAAVAAAFTFTEDEVAAAWETLPAWRRAALEGRMERVLAETDALEEEVGRAVAALRARTGSQGAS